MCNIHTKDASRHVADNAHEVARFVIEDAHLVAACTSSNNEILLAIEHCSVEHRSSLGLELLHVLFFIIFEVHFLDNVAVLFNIGFPTIKTVPFISFDAFH